MKGRIFLKKRKMQVIGSLVIFYLAIQSPMVQAQGTYPNRPITLLVGVSAGGVADLGARMLADSAGKILGKPIAVINKPGGSWSVALSGLMAESPDGYTIGVLSSAGILMSLLKKLSYDPVKDFTPIIQYGAFQDGLVVRVDSPWKTLKEFMDFAKKNPGKIRYASSGIGTPEYLIMERISMEQGIKWLHIPYDGGTQSAAALLGGHVDAAAESSGGWKPYVDAGRFRLLATFHEKRMGAYPDVPTFMEWGYNMKAASLMSIAGPKGLPDSVVTKLHGAFKKSMEDPNFITLMERLGALIVYRGPEDLQSYIQEIVVKEGEIIQQLGLRK